MVNLQVQTNTDLNSHYVAGLDYAIFGIGHILEL